MTVVEFGALFHFIRNGMNVKQDKSGEGLPITRIETISDSFVDAGRLGYAGLTESQCRNWLLEPGDILLSHINSVDHIGKCAVYRGQPAKLVHGMNLLCLRSDSTKVLPEFAKYLIRSAQFRSRLSNSIKKAVNQASVSIGDLKAIPVGLPPLAKQRRIAEVLDRAEALRAKRRAALAQLDTLAQAIFLDMFGDPSTNPKAWPAKRLGELCQRITDIDHKMPVAVEDGVPFISAKDLSDDGRISFESVKRISREDFVRLARKSRPEKGDIIYSRIGVNLGKARIVDVDFEFVASYSCCTIKPRHELVETSYLCNLLDSPFILRQAQNGVRAIAVPDLGLGEIKMFKIILPPIEMQRDFARHTAAVETMKAKHRTSLAGLDILFATLQHCAFRGEL